MLRGPVQAAFPSLDHFPREAGASGHVYPFTARSTSPGIHQCADLRLPSSLASATFWRSPYSEAIRQSRSTGSKRQSSDPQSASTRSQETQPASAKDKGTETVKSILKGGGSGGSEGRDSGSDTSSENARGQIRGILCKSSLSSSSRQSGSKVQKRVKFDESVDSRSVVCQRQTASASGATCRGVPRSPHDHHRALSASAAIRAPVRMPTLRNDGDRLQSVDKACLHQHANQTAYQHVHRASSGALSRCGSVPDLGLPKPALRDPYRHQHPASYQLLHSPHSSLSGGVNINTGVPRLSPTELEFKIYRRSSSVQPGSPTQGDHPSSQTHPEGRTRFFVTRSSASSGGGSRAMVRLTRSLTSPSISVSRPVKRPTPTQPCTHDELPLVLTSGRMYPHPHTHPTPTHPDFDPAYRSGMSGVQKESESEEDDAQSFLDDDKTVQILHWLKEVDHKQAREGRCPVFVNSIYREG